MNVEKFNQIVEQTVRSTAQLLKTKGVEYTDNDDRLIQFKRAADLTGVTPLQVALVYMSKHYGALATYIRNDASGIEQILNEPIDGRIDDLINYCYLIKALIHEV